MIPFSWILELVFKLWSSCFVIHHIYKDVCNTHHHHHQESGIRTPPPLQRERPTRLNLLASKTRSHSSSPSVQKRHPKHLMKTRSCKTLRELEVEEVKGFMDLGFTFNKQHLTKRIMRLIPGLRRLEEEQEEDYNVKEENQKLLLSNEEDEAKKKGDDDEDEKGSAGIIRPYLSEAWLINRPDSPLLNLRVPRASAAADMKKHLKYWARTVATVIHQES